MTFGLASPLGSLGTANAVTPLSTVKQIVVTQQPTASVLSGAIFAQQPKIQLQKANGDNVAIEGETITATIILGTGGTLGGTMYALTDSNGTASFSDLKITGLGDYTLLFQSVSLGYSVRSNAITISGVVVPPVAVVSISAPQLYVGSTFVADTTGSTGSPNPTFTYQWARADSASGTFANISGATASTYVAAEADYQKYLNVTVVATSDGSSDTETATSVGPISTLAPTAAVSITGDPVVGFVLSADTSATTGIPSPSFTYQWSRSESETSGFSDLMGETNATYTLVSGDADRYFRVKVVASNFVPETSTATSASSAKIAATPVAPEVSASITGDKMVGSTLTVVPTVQAGIPTPSFTYQWASSETSTGGFMDISGATASTYVLTGAEFGMYIQATVVGTNAAGSDTATAMTSSTVTGAPLNAAVMITGLQAKNYPLTADTTATTGFPVPTFTYQWSASSSETTGYVDIAGADTATYTVDPLYVGKYLRVTVVATNVVETDTAVSMPTFPIVDTPTAPSAVVAITGVPTIGSVLTADTTGTVGTQLLTPVFVWQRSSSSTGPFVDISGATASTYTVSDDDFASYLRVKFTAQNAIDSSTVESSPTAVVTISTDAKLSALSTTAGALSPAFVGTTTAYSVGVANGVTSVTVTPTVNQPAATIQVRINGGTYVSQASGVASSALSLNVGANPIDVKVTAGDATTVLTYTITVTREAAPVVPPVITPVVTPVVTTTPVIPTISTASPLIVPILANEAKTVVANVLGPDGKLTPVTINIPAGVSGLDGNIRILPIFDAESYALGIINFEIQVLDVFGAVIPTLQKPLTLLFKSIAGDYIVAKSADGFLWSPIPLITATVLPEGLDAAYYLDANGNVVILTRSLSQFGLKKRQLAFVATSPVASIKVDEVAILATSGGNGGGSIRFTSTTAGICTVTSAGAVKGVSAGTCLVDAVKGGDPTYLNANADTVSILVQAAATTTAVPGTVVKKPFKRVLKATGTKLTKSINVKLGPKFAFKRVTMLIRKPGETKYSFLTVVELNKWGGKTLRKAVPLGSKLRVTIAKKALVTSQVVQAR